MIFDSKYSTCQPNQKKVVSKESGNEHILYNNNEYPVFQYHIDGGIITGSQGERCDYILEVQKPEKGLAYIIELKGSDLNKALSQIENTIRTYSSNLKGYKILPRVVIHKASTHQINGKKYRDFKKSYPAVIVKSIKLEESV